MATFEERKEIETINIFNRHPNKQALIDLLDAKKQALLMKTAQFIEKKRTQSCTQCGDIISNPYPHDHGLFLEGHWKQCIECGDISCEKCTEGISRTIYAWSPTAYMEQPCRKCYEKLKCKYCFKCCCQYDKRKRCDQCGIGECCCHDIPFKQCPIIGCGNNICIVCCEQKYEGLIYPCTHCIKEHSLWETLKLHKECIEEGKIFCDAKISFISQSQNNNGNK